MGLDLCDNSSRTSEREEKDLNEKLFSIKKLMSSLKEINGLSKENLKQEEKLKIYKLENERLIKKLVELNSQ